MTLGIKRIIIAASPEDDKEEGQQELHLRTKKKMVSDTASPSHNATSHTMAGKATLARWRRMSQISVMKALMEPTEMAQATRFSSQLSLSLHSA